MRPSVTRSAQLLLLISSVVGCNSPETDASAEDRVRATTRAELPTETEQRVGSYLAPWIERGDFKGVVLIAKGDDILALRAFGLDDAAVPEPKTGTIFRIASLTKTLTAATILIYRDQGRLALDDPLDRFLPGFPSGDRITIEALLAHAGGVANPDEELYWRKSVSLEDVVENIASKPLVFEPGTESRYSNAGYNILARVIEIVGGKAYEDALREAIFDPLRMSSTGNYIGAENPRLIGGNTPGPGPDGVAPVTGQNFTASLGSGSLATTASDLHRWGLAVARGDLFSFDGLFWPFGWGKIETAGQQGLEQTGLTAGYTASLAVYPDQEVVVVCLNAVEAADWIRWNQDLSRIAFGESVEAPELPRTGPPPANPEAYVGSYTGEDGTARIEYRDGLFLFMGESRVGKYLTAAEDGGFFLRNDMGTVTFETGSEETVESLTWDLGDRAMRFDRSEG